MAAVQSNDVLSDAVVCSSSIEDVTNNAAEDVTNIITGDVTNRAAENVTNNIATGDATNRVAEDVTNNIATVGDATNRVAEDATNNIATGDVTNKAAEDVTNNIATGDVTNKAAVTNNAESNVAVLADVSSTESETEIPTAVDKSDTDLVILSVSETASSSPSPTTITKPTDATESEPVPVGGHIQVKKLLWKDVSSPVASKRSFFTSPSTATVSSSPLWTSSPQDRRTREQAIKAEKERILSLPLEKKRQLYYCGDDYYILKEVQTWHDHLKKDRVKRRYPKADDIEHHFSDFRFEADELVNKKVSIWRGDITTLEIDAIVNAANSSLLGGGGVDGAIHRAAGSALLAECRTLNGCQTGDAKTTAGYRLPAKYVVHTVGPQGEYQKPLRSCYHRCLEELDKHNLKSIAFPCISTGIYGYSNEKAVHVALKTVRDWLNDKKLKHKLDSIDRVIFCVFLDCDTRLYESWMQVYFPDSSKLVTPGHPPGRSLDEKTTSSDRNSSNSGTKLKLKSADRDDSCSEFESIVLSDSDATDGDQESAKADTVAASSVETLQPTTEPPTDSVSSVDVSHKPTESEEPTGSETSEVKAVDCPPEQVTLKTASEAFSEKPNNSSPTVELLQSSTAAVDFNIQLPERCPAEVDAGCTDNEIRDNETDNSEQILTVPELVFPAAVLKPLSSPTHIPIFGAESDLPEKLVSETIPVKEDCDAKISSGNGSAACKRHEHDSPLMNIYKSDHYESTPKRQKCDEFNAGSVSHREAAVFCDDDQTNEQRAACIAELKLDEEFDSPSELA